MCYNISILPNEEGSPYNAMVDLFKQNDREVLRYSIKTFWNAIFSVKVSLWKQRGDKDHGYVEIK